MSDENVFARRLDYCLSKLEWGDINEKLIKAGISYSNLQWWRTGRHMPKLDKFMALADALGVSLDWLAGHGPDVNIKGAKG